MISWLNFWAVSLVVAGVSFVLITVIVAVKGYADLREMFKGLMHQRANHHE